MSVKVMTLAWSLDLPDSQKIVLLALADCANDEGHCWPSMASLARKCSKGERTVQGVIKQLVEAGHVTREEVRGKGCIYWVHPRRDCAPQASRPAMTAPPQGTAQTPAAAADKPSRTIKVLSNDKTKRALGKRDCPEGVPPDLWADFLEQRKTKFTPNALKGLLAEADKARWTLEAVLSECVSRGWQGFKADWVKDNGRNSRPERKSVLDIAAELGGDCGPPVGLPSLGPPGWHDRG